jgi:hypothetical protein
MRSDCLRNDRSNMNNPVRQLSIVPILYLHHKAGGRPPTRSSRSFQAMRLPTADYAWTPSSSRHTRFPLISWLRGTRHKRKKIKKCGGLLDHREVRTGCAETYTQACAHICFAQQHTPLFCRRTCKEDHRDECVTS